MAGEAVFFIVLGVIGGVIFLAARRRGPRPLRAAGAALAVIGASFAVAQVIGPPVMIAAVKVVCDRPDVTYC